MGIEKTIVEYISRTCFDDIPAEVIETVKDEVRSILGATIPGANAEGGQAMRDLALEVGGAAESSILIHGGKVPAQQAAFVNAFMTRALDFCDAIVPGAHPGAATVATALAAAEMVGGVGGAEFLAAVCVGDEVAIRLNLGEAEYDGFDPTGVCVPFGATAAAARILGLNEEQTANALGLAFCRCGGSFQANVDGVLALRVIEGWVAENGVSCARLARRGITRPPNFLDGIYGYFHLYGRDRVNGEAVLSGLGSDYRLNKSIVFKKFPSCGGTQAATELILDLVRSEDLAASDVEWITMTVPPYIYKLVGHPFHLGTNPKANAQFSIRYCVANALHRGAPTFTHFEAGAIRNPEVLALVQRIEAVPDPALDARGHTAIDMQVLTRTGREFVLSTDVAPGFPEKPLSREEHVSRFHDCMAFAGKSPITARAAEILRAVDRIDQMKDVRELVDLLVP